MLLLLLLLCVLLLVRWGLRDVLLGLLLVTWWLVVLKRLLELLLVLHVGLLVVLLGLGECQLLYLYQCLLARASLTVTLGPRSSCYGLGLLTTVLCNIPNLLELLQLCCYRSSDCCFCCCSFHCIFWWGILI